MSREESLIGALRAERLLHGARAGSSADLGKLLEAYWPCLLSDANRALPSHYRPKVGASDFVQETYLAAQKGFAQFRGESLGEFVCWLRQILTRCVLSGTRVYKMKCRELGREVSLGGPIPGTLPEQVLGPERDPADALVAREDWEQFSQALGRLPLVQQDAILLRYEQGLSWEEVGKAIGRSPEAARRLAGRARREVRDVHLGPQQ